MTREIDLTAQGAFCLGANYWASHAGTRMWADWRPDIVEEDLKALSEAGIQVLRVFPLWSDFQPITLLRGHGGRPVEIRHGQDPLPDDSCGQAGLSPEMMDRFAEFLEIARRHDLKLIVGLLTGWMSGRLHVPPALEGANALTDALALRWELRFIREFAGRFRGHPAIVGWDLGNECNCMAPVESSHEAYAWTATVANAIRCADPDLPVVSGLHGLRPEGTWTMQDHGELLDLLTTHPYPVFLRHGDHDPANTIGTTMQSAAESRFYADIGGKPCLCQEIGTLGPMVASDEISGDFVRAAAFSLWANDCHGLIWWCANDQTQLEHAPYDWHAMERELGLRRVDGTAKPALMEIGKFRRFLDSLPFDRLPLRRREAVCILTSEQDHWAAAFGAFVFAKQAGFDLEFQYQDQPLKEADLYLLPSLCGHGMILRHRLLPLLERVREGATLYLSLESGLPSTFEEITGLETQTRERRREFGPVRMTGLEGSPSIPAAGDFKLRMKATRATVLGREEDGSPAFAAADYGKGRVFFLGVPIETTAARTPGSLHLDSSPPYWQVYRHIAADVMRQRAVTKSHPFLALTEHPFSEAERLIVAINHSPQEIEADLSLAGDWSLEKVSYGSIEPQDERLAARIAANDAVVFSIRRRAGG